jgi:hypothetical protein
MLVQVGRSLRLWQSRSRLTDYIIFLAKILPKSDIVVLSITNGLFSQGQNGTNDLGHRADRPLSYIG